MTHTHAADAALLPYWLRVAWVVLLCVVGAVHLRHMRTMRGQHRFWHLGHVAMATGMAYMYLPTAAQPVPNTVLLALFGFATGAALGAAITSRTPSGGINPLWILSAIEMSAMTYMLLPATSRSFPLSYVLAIYLAGTGLLWALGNWDRHYLGAERPVRPSWPALRTSLVVMSTGMAYMLLAM